MKTRCRKGHPLNAKTTYLGSLHYNGKRYVRCRTCHALACAEWRIRRIIASQPRNQEPIECRPC
jgi:hypothetical protein